VDDTSHFAFGSVKEPCPCLGGPTSRSDDITLPEPPRGFCLGFGLAEGQVIVSCYRQLIPVLGATTFRDPRCNIDPAGPIQDGF